MTRGSTQTVRIGLSVTQSVDLFRDGAHSVFLCVAHHEPKSCRRALVFGHPIKRIRRVGQLVGVAAVAVGLVSGLFALPGLPIVLGLLVVVHRDSSLASRCRVGTEGSAHRGLGLGYALGATQRRAAMTAPEQLYRFLFQEQQAAASELKEPGWLRLGLQHAMLFRFGDKPNGPKAAPPESVLSDAVISRIAGWIGDGTGGWWEVSLSIVDELARDMCVADVQTLIEMYPGDMLDVREEEGMLSRLVNEDLRHVLSPAGEPHIPEYYLCQPGWREFEAAEEELWAPFERR
jgi:hypothetical protein